MLKYRYCRWSTSDDHPSIIWLRCIFSATNISKIQFNPDDVDYSGLKNVEYIHPQLPRISAIFDQPKMCLCICWTLLMETSSFEYTSSPFLVMRFCLYVWSSSFDVRFFSHQFDHEGRNSKHKRAVCLTFSPFQFMMCNNTLAEKEGENKAPQFEYSHEQWTHGEKS